MEINSANMKTLFTGYKALFAEGLGQAPTDHELFTEVVTSGTEEEEYPWLGNIPGMREWIGDRVINNLKDYGYKLKNRDFENTVAVPRNKIEDDKYGQYGMSMKLLGRAAASQPCELAYATLKDGFTTPCYDGQFFFDTDHPVLDKDGNEVSVSNTGGGAGEPWFLMCTTKLLKPVLLQKRKEPVFVAKDALTDENLFHKKQFLYGADLRDAGGYTLWQLIWADRRPLNATNYSEAREAMMSYKGDYGVPLGIVPETLLVGPKNERNGKKVVVNKRLANGEDNDLADTAKLVVTPWLA